jgi:putative transposase
VGVCRTHYLRDLLTQVPKSQGRWVATMVRTIFDQPDAVEVHAQFDRVVAALRAKLPKAGEHLAEAREQLLPFTGFPRECWTQIWSNNPVRHEAPWNRGEVRVLSCRAVAAA